MRKVLFFSLLLIIFISCDKERIWSVITIGFVRGQVADLFQKNKNVYTLNSAMIWNLDLESYHTDGATTKKCVVK